jgi:hypothetical protein
MTKEECARRDNRRHGHDGLVDIKSPDHRSIEPQEIQKEAPNRVRDQVNEEYVAVL